MIWLRSALFQVTFLSWTIVLAILCLWMLALPRGAVFALVRFWVRSVFFLARVFCGVRWSATGLDGFDARGKIIAAQHQSAFETYAVFLMFERPVFILKRELMWIPLIGWYLAKLGMGGIDRGAGASAMRQVIHKAKDVIDAGETLVIFPEGTRVRPGEERPYQPGIAALYAHVGAPVVPMAVHSGAIWGRTSFTRNPGEIKFALGAPLEPGLQRDAMLARLREKISTAWPDGGQPAQGDEISTKAS